MNTTINIQTNDYVIYYLMSHDYMPCDMSCGMQETVGCGAPTQAIYTYITALVLPTRTTMLGDTSSLHGHVYTLTHIAMYKTELMAYFSGLVIREVVIAQPHAQGAALQFGSYKGIELQRWTQTRSLFSRKLNLRVRRGEGERVNKIAESSMPNMLVDLTLLDMQWNPSNQDALGTRKMPLLEGYPHFTGQNVYNCGIQGQQ